MIKTVLIYPLSVGNETLSVESSKLFLIFNNPVQGKNKAVMQHLKYKIQSSKILKTSPSNLFKYLNNSNLSLSLTHTDRFTHTFMHSLFG